MSYNIAFTADNGYIQHLATAMQSLLENNKDLNLTIYVISGDISDTNADKLQYITKQYDNANLKILLIKDDIFNDFILVWYLAKGIYYRLLIPDLITDDKVLYLDSDSE